MTPPHDPHFPRERWDAVYEKWIADACAGDSDCVLVVRSEARAVGYMTCVIEARTTGRMGLGAVAAAERGQGFGDRLARGTLRWLAGHGCERVLVASQARNLEATRLYERLGFQAIAVEHWYHLWLPAGGRA